MTKDWKDIKAEGENPGEQADWWVIALDCHDGEITYQKAFEHWLDLHPDNRPCFNQARFLWGELDFVATAVTGTDERPRKGSRLPASKAQSAGRSRLGHIHWWISGSLAAICLLAMTVTGVGPRDLLENLRADYVTADGGRRTVDLPDGSKAYMNADSALSVDYAEGGRQVRVLRGEVYFDVRPDPYRPFIVWAGESAARALGTEYLVAYRGRDSRIYVTEGTVEVVSAHQGRQQALRLGGQQGAIVSADGALVSDEDGHRMLDWREGRLTVRSLPIDELVTLLDRHYEGRLLLIGDSRRLQPVSGSFHLGDVAQTVRSLAASLKADLMELPAGIILLKI